MKIQYFGDTDTLFIQFRLDAKIEECCDLDEDTLAEYDGAGHLCALTLERAKQKADAANFNFEWIAA